MAKIKELQQEVVTLKNTIHESTVNFQEQLSGALREKEELQITSTKLQDRNQKIELEKEQMLVKQNQLAAKE